MERGLAPTLAADVVGCAFSQAKFGPMVGKTARLASRWTSTFESKLLKPLCQVQVTCPPRLVTQHESPGC